MKMVKSLLLGTAAGLVAVAGAQAADLPVKAKPVQYVKICSLYGAGFYYIPGTDTCLKIGGYVRFETSYNAANSYGVPAPLNLDNRNGGNNWWRARSVVSFDTRSQTAYGTLRSYFYISATDDNSAVNSATGGAGVNGAGASGYTRIYAPQAFIQFAGFTFGKTTSFFDFDNNAYTNSSPFALSNQGGNGSDLIGYTAQFGNGLSATLAAENADSRRHGIANTDLNVAQTSAYANQSYPDIVANLRIDQAWGSGQVMGALHAVRATDASGVGGVHPSDETGWAVGAGLKLNLPMLGRGDYIQGQVTYSEGAVDYINSNSPLSQMVTKGYNGAPVPTVDSVAYGASYDAVVSATNNLELTKAWGFAIGYEHMWNAQWKTSLWGDYTSTKYSAAANAVLAPAGATSGNANWTMWQIGSRTTWTPVANLDLSVEVMYQKLDQNYTGVDTAANGAGAFKDQDWVSAMFRAQRNFWP
jgi:hypothetical protein